MRPLAAALLSLLLSGCLRPLAPAPIRTALRLPENDWQAARVRLVCDAKTTLAALEAARIPRRDRPRVKELISTALLHTTSYAEFSSAYPSLQRMVLEEVEARRKIAMNFPEPDDWYGRVHIEDYRCMPFLPVDCPPTPRQIAEKRLLTLPGLSVPALIDMSAHPRPMLRSIAGTLMHTLHALQAMSAMANHRADVTPIWHYAETDSSSFPAGDAFDVIPVFASEYAFWHPATQSTEIDLNEQRMRNAIRELCTIGLVHDQLYHLPSMAMSADAWDHPILIQVSHEPRVDLTLWSLGPDGAPGGDDDILRHLATCKTLPKDPKAPIPWTYAGGGTVALKPPPSAAGDCGTRR